MREPLHNDDFEHYLQEQVKEHRMYPSDHIWRNIQDNMHGKSRWPALTFISIFIIVALVVGTMVVKPNYPVITTAVQPVTPAAITVKKATSDNATADNNTISPVQNLENGLSPEHITQLTIAAVSKKIQEQDVAGKTTPDAVAIAPVNVENTIPVELNKNIDRSVVLNTNIVNNALPHASVVEKNIAEKSVDAEDGPLKNSADISTALNSLKNYNAISQLSNPADFDGNNSKPAEVFSSNDAKQYSANDFFNAPKKTTSRLRPSRFELQFYVTPSSSYRRLVDSKDKNFAQPFSVPVSANYRIDVNQVVRQRPATGTEVGIGVGYKLNDRFTLKTGLQFNIRQYNIEAYSYNYEEASVSLNGDYGPETLSSYTRFRNYATGSSPITLNNRYYQLSIPVGIDYRVLSIGKLSWNVAAAVQPTYTFDKDPFIITSDYKNYADGSSLMRNWNFNTNFETYISYKVGSFRWQIGPQFRYQQLPTLSSKYPIREYLLDYGIKIGFTKTIK